MTERLYKILFFMLFTTGFTYCSAQSAQLLTHQSSQRASVKGISPNGKWATGYAGGDNSGISPFLWNLETDEIISVYSGESGEATAKDVADNGMIAGSYENVPAVYENGQWNSLPIPEEFNTGMATGISADGNTIIGYVFLITENTGSKMQVCKWVNKKLVTLTIPEKDSRGEDAVANKLEYISADGNTILGRLNYIYPLSSTPVLWNAESTPVIICEDIYYNEDGSRNQTSIFTNISLSSNGQYVTGYASYDCGDPMKSYASFIYDTQTTKTAVYDTNETSASGFAIDNNGVAYESAGTTAIRTAYIRINGVQIPLNDYLKKEYGLDIETVQYKNLGTVIAISEDNKILTGFESPGNNWCLKLSVAPATASAQSIEREKASVSVSGKVMTVCGEVQQITLTDMTGQNVFDQNAPGNTIHLNGIGKGIYIATIRMENQKIVIRKIILD